MASKRTGQEKITCLHRGVQCIRGFGSERLTASPTDPSQLAYALKSGSIAHGIMPPSTELLAGYGEHSNRVPSRSPPSSGVDA